MADKGLTIRQLIKYNNIIQRYIDTLDEEELKKLKFDAKYNDYIRLIRAAKGLSVNRRMYIKGYMSTIDDRRKPTIHKSVVVAKESNKKRLVDQQVLVSCSCPYHKFYCEYVLVEAGASFFRPDSYKEKPVEKNPDDTIYTCKHLNVLLRTIYNKKL